MILSKNYGFTPKEIEEMTPYQQLIYMEGISDESNPDKGVNRLREMKKAAGVN